MQVEHDTTTETALDAYSRTVIDVAEGMTASVANLQVARRTRRGEATGGGSAVVIAPDGYLLTSAHVVEGSTNGTASFSDGRNTPISLVGTDRLSDLARAPRRRPRPAAGRPRRRRAAARRPARGGDRQSPRVRQLGHGRRRQRPRPLAADGSPRRPAAPRRERHPDRRGAQPGQLGRCARRQRLPRGRHQHRARRVRARPRGADQPGHPNHHHRAHARGPGPPRAARRRRRPAPAASGDRRASRPSARDRGRPGRRGRRGGSRRRAAGRSPARDRSASPSRMPPICSGSWSASASASSCRPRCCGRETSAAVTLVPGELVG